jgi:hypothetical protein
LGLEKRKTTGMWIINEDGFFSAVEDWNDSSRIYVRGRSRTDLETFIEVVVALPENSYWTPELTHTPNNDYAWRVHTPREFWVAYLAAKANGLDYGNFKSHCGSKWRSENRDHAEERISLLSKAWMLFYWWPASV